MSRPGRWVFLTDAGFDIGHGHLSRTRVLARAVTESGGEPLVVLARPVPVDLGPVAHAVVPFTEDALVPALASLDADHDLVMLDLPDEALTGLPWLGRLPVFRAAFRMFGPGPDAVEHVSLTPAYRPDRVEIGTVGGTGTEARGALRLPLARLTGWSAIMVRPSLFDGASDGGGPVTVLVTMGGSDPHDLTSLACRHLLDLAADVAVVVAVGRGNPRFEALRAECGSVMSVVRPTDDEFDDLLRAATVAVINGGLTRYECMAAATPFVAIAMHDRQAAITREVTSRGFGVDLGPYDRLAPGAVAGAVESLLADGALRHDMVVAARRHVRRDAPARIVARIARFRSTLAWRGA